MNNLYIGEIILFRGVAAEITGLLANEDGSPARVRLRRIHPQEGRMTHWFSAESFAKGWDGVHYSEERQTVEQIIAGEDGS